LLQGTPLTGDIAQKVLLNDSKVNARISDKFDTLFNYSDFFTRDQVVPDTFVLLTILFIYFLTKGTIKIKSVAFMVICFPCPCLPLCYYWEDIRYIIHGWDT